MKSYGDDFKTDYDNRVGEAWRKARTNDQTNRRLFQGKYKTPCKWCGKNTYGQGEYHPTCRKQKDSL